jgi:hypothetical protein
VEGHEAPGGAGNSVHADEPSGALYLTFDLYLARFEAGGRPRCPEAAGPLDQEVQRRALVTQQLDGEVALAVMLAVLAAMLGLEVASGNDAIASHSEIRKTAKLMGQFLPGTDFVTSGYSVMPRHDNTFGGGNFDADDLDGEVAIRNVRRDGMDHLKQDEKKHEISEDEQGMVWTGGAAVLPSSPPFWGRFVMRHVGGGQR